MSTDLNPRRHAINIGSGRSRLPQAPSFQGVYFTGYTTAERMALSLGASDEGLVVFDKDDNVLVLWDGAKWTDTDASTDVGQPTFTSVSPTSGNSGTALTIVGTNFLGATAVTIGGVAATSFSVTDDTHIAAVAPAHANGAVSIVITTKDGSVTAATAFTYA